MIVDDSRIEWRTDYGYGKTKGWLSDDWDNGESVYDNYGMIMIWLWNDHGMTMGWMENDGWKNMGWLMTMGSLWYNNIMGLLNDASIWKL